MTPARVGSLRTPCLRQSVYRLSDVCGAVRGTNILLVQSGKCEMSSVFTYYLELLIVCIILTYDTLRGFGCYIKHYVVNNVIDSTRELCKYYI